MPDSSSLTFSGVLSNGCAAIGEDQELLEDKEVENLSVAKWEGAHHRDEDKVPNPTKETGALGDNHVVDPPRLGIPPDMWSSITGPSLIRSSAARCSC